MVSNEPKTGNLSSNYELCYYTGVVGMLYSFVHQQIEKPFKKGARFERILELGAGSGEHLPFVKCDYQEYVMSDIAGPNDRMVTILDKHKFTKFLNLDAHNLRELPDKFFDRVVATCLIVHLSDPFLALSEWRRVLKPGGHLTIYVAPEPGWLIRLTRKMLFWPKARRNGNLSPEFSAYQEHRIHFLTVSSSISKVFQQDLKVHKRFPTRFLSWNFSFFDIYHITKCQDLEC